MEINDTIETKLEKTLAKFHDFCSRFVNDESKSMSLEEILTNLEQFHDLLSQIQFEIYTQ